MKTATLDNRPTALPTPAGGHIPERYVRTPRTGDSAARQAYAMERFHTINRGHDIDAWIALIAVVGLVAVALMGIAGWLPGAGA